MRARPGLGLFGMVWAVPVLIACSSTSNDGDGTASAGEVAAFIASGLCDEQERCFREGITQFFGDKAACVARTEAAARLVFSAPGAKVAATKLAACRERLRTFAADCSDYPILVRAPECDFTGTLPDGAPCGDRVQCASGSCARKAVAVGGGGFRFEPCGTCMARVGEGADCSIADCDVGLGCLALRNGSNVCVFPPGPGEPCGATQPCGGTLRCVGGKCTPAQPAGSACSGGFDCGSASPCCENSTYCKPNDPAQPKGAGTCTPFGHSGPGGKCGPDAATAELTLCTDAACSGPGGTCTAAIPDGAACEADSTTAFCRPPATCQNGTCALVDPGACR